MLNRDIRTLFKHSSVYGIGTIAGQALGFLLLPLYTRYLTPADYGIAALIEILMSLAGLTVGAGVLNGMTRFYHESTNPARKKRVVSTMFWIVSAFSVGTFLIFFFLSETLAQFIFSDPSHASLFRISAGALAIGFLVDTALLYLVILERSMAYVSISLVTLVLQVAFNVFFLVHEGMGIQSIFLSTLITRSILLFVVAVPVLFKTGLKFSPGLSLDIFRYSFPLIFSSLFRLAANESDKYFINHFFSPFETGIYAVASKLGTAVHTLVTTSFLRSYNPKRFELLDQHNHRETLASIFSYYLLATVSAGLALSIFSSEILRIMATPSYLPAAQYIPFIVTAWVVFGARYHFETGILITKKTKLFAYINGVTALLAVLLNYFLIERFQIWGAVVSLNISQILTTFLFYRSSQALYPVPYDFVYALKLILLASSLFILASWIESPNILLSIALKSVVLALYVYFLRRFRLIDDALARQIRQAKNSLLRFPATLKVPQD